MIKRQKTRCPHCGLNSVVITDDELKDILNMLNNGEKVGEVADKFGVKRPNFYAILKKRGLSLKVTRNWRIN